MSNDDKDNSRRTFLTGTTCALFAAGAAGLATPYVKAWNPSARAIAAGAPIKVDLSKIPEGTLVIEEWRGKPIYIMKRTKEMLASMQGLDDQLRNPGSDDSQQPDYAKNSTRSIKPKILVMVGLCTHLGCTPKLRGGPGQSDADFSGFFCPCHSSKFDFSGRVYKGVPAPTNLEIPPHYYIDDNTLIVGQEREELA